MKKFFKSLLTLAMLILCFSFTALANSEGEMKVFDKKTNMEPNKQWTIKLNMELDSNSIENNVYISDKNGNKISVSITISEDGKSIIVQAPKEGYKYGETYTLQIKSSFMAIKSKSAKALNKEASMEFTIKADPNAAIPEVRGNTSGNINNSGKMVQIGDWTYFNGNIYNKEMDGFYKMKSDGSSKTLLAKGDPWYINVVGEWIYYYDLEDCIFYKMKTDGSNRSVFIKENGTLLKVLDGWAYYISLGYDTLEEVCRIKLDGTSKTRISKMRALGFDISNGYVYFSSFKENTLYKVKADGNELTPLNVKDRPNEIIASKDWIYYSANTSTDKTKLYKVSPSGDNITQLSDNNVYNINLIGDYLYYIRFDDSEYMRNLYKVKTDGTGEKEIDTSGIYFFYSVGDWIYCQSYSENNFKIKSDGTRKETVYMPLEEIKGTTVGNINNEGLMVQSGDWIYYTNLFGEGLYKMKSDGTSKTLLSKDNPKDINVIGDWIYFIAGDLELYKINTNGSGKVKLIEGMVDNILVVNDWIYYVSLTNYGEEFICKVKTDGSSKTVIARGRNYTFDVSNGWVFYTQYNNGLYKIKTDGTGKTTLIEGLKPSEFVVDRGYVYYYDKSDEGRLYRISVNGTDKSKLSDNDIGNPNVIGDYVFYINFNDSQSKRVLHRVKVDGTGDKAIDSTPVLHITSVGEWIYCTTQDNKVFKIKPDGTGKQFITN